MGSRRGVLGLGLLAVGIMALPTADLAAHATVRDLDLRAEELTLRSAALDDSVELRESRRATQLLLAADVLFGFDRATVAPGDVDRLDLAVRRIRQRRPRQVRVVGHTDARGSAAYNLGLSRRRAEAVARVLRRHLAADPPRIESIGRGEAEPVAPDRTPDGADDPRNRSRNRRVTVSFERQYY